MSNPNAAPKFRINRLEDRIVPTFLCGIFSWFKPCSTSYNVCDNGSNKGMSDKGYSDKNGSSKKGGSSKKAGSSKKNGSSKKVCKNGSSKKSVAKKFSFGRKFGKC